MKIETNVDMHTHYIEELFKTTNQLIDREQKMNVRMGIAEHVIELQGVNMAKVVAKTAHVADLIEKMNSDGSKRFYTIEFIREILGSPKLIIMAVGFIFLVDLAMGFHDLAKYFLR